MELNVPNPTKKMPTADFDLSNPYDHYLHSLLLPSIDAVTPTETTMGVRPTPSDGEGEHAAPADSRSHIAGPPVTGKHYSPNLCPACATKLPWEPQCPACSSAFKGRLAIARAEAGVVRAETPPPELPDGKGGLRNTNSFEEFMARQLHLPLIESVE